MVGASFAHVLIVTNLVVQLRTQLKGRSCQVLSNNLRLRVSPAGLYTYPDVIVACAPLAFADGYRDTLTNPTVIIEVLSETTKDYDRGGKLPITARSPRSRNICCSTRRRCTPSTSCGSPTNDTVSKLVAEAVETTFQEAEELRRHVTDDDIDFLLDGVGQNRGDDYLGVAAIQTVRKVVRFLENPNILPAELRIGGQIASIIPREPLSYRRLAETPLLISGRVLCVDDAKRLTKIASEDPGYGMEIGFRGGHRRTLVRAQLDNAVVKLSYLPRLDLFTRELETNQGELVEILSISGAASSKASRRNAK
jgi:hypothetical protein